MFCLYKLWGGSWLGDCLGGQASPASRHNYGVRDTITALLPVSTTLKGANTFFVTRRPLWALIGQGGLMEKIAGRRVNYVSLSWQWRWWSSCWTGNISSLNIITSQAWMDNTDQSEDSPNQADQWRTNERAVQCWASLRQKSWKKFVSITIL